MKKRKNLGGGYLRKIRYPIILILTIGIGVLLCNNSNKETILKEETQENMLAIYLEDEQINYIPEKDSGYTLDLTKSSCNNGVTIGFDYNTWSVKTNFQNYINPDNSRVKCSLYFKKIPLATEYILSLADSSDELVYDETTDNNLRYIGADPDNYIDIGDNSLWRIIGVMNNIDDGTGKVETRLKIVRNESIGEYSWDTSDVNVNGGYGVNEWSQSNLMKLLNPGYENENIGGSLYWNSSSGNCYTSYENATSSCNFENLGLTEKAKQYIENAIWNTGTNGENGYETNDNGLTSHWYTYERSSNTGKICTPSTNNYCNDNIERTTTWTGIVGLIYPSDYGYATSGGSEMSREECLSSRIVGWNAHQDCYGNSWLLQTSNQWTITPMVYRTSAITSMYVNSTGYAGPSNTHFKLSVYPIVYIL